MTAPTINSRAQDGFSLIESIVAVAIIGSILIISTAFLNSLAGASAGLVLHSEMLRELEATTEMMRAGFLPLESATVLYAGSNERFRDLQVTAVVEQREVAGLYLVVVRAECTVAGRRVSRTLTTQMWRP